jgi:hypothetical protein
MPVPQAFRNDDVERTAKDFGLREAEDAGGAAVPQADHALGICIHDRVRHARNETVGEMRSIKVHNSSQTPAM